jgi:hypothetical protein
MSIESISTCLYRIEGAGIDSPIAVFECCIEKKAQVTFANTYESRRRIRSNDPRLIGVYHRGIFDLANREIRQRVFL